MRIVRLLLLFSLIWCSGCINQWLLRPAFDHPYRPTDYGYQFDEINLPCNGKYVQIWHIYSKESRALAVVIPGSDANKSRYTNAAPLFIEKGIDLIVMDYPGFGDSPGPKSISNCIDGARVVVNYAVSKHKHVFLLGFSLGTPIATRMACDYSVDGLFMEGVLVMKEYMYYQTGPGGAVIDAVYVRPQTPPDMDIKKYIKQVRQPKLMFNSSEDRITPIKGAQDVYSLASQPKQFEIVRGEHGKMVTIDPDWWSGRITEWMTSVMTQNP